MVMYVRRAPPSQYARVTAARTVEFGELEHTQQRPNGVANARMASESSRRCQDRHHSRRASGAPLHLTHAGDQDV